MKGKKCLIAAIAAAITMSATGALFTGCVSTMNENDLKQIVAEVDITNADGFEKEVFADGINGKTVKSAVQKEEISKRDLLMAFMNVGSNYVNSGYSYADAFDAILSGLVENAVVTQYAVASLAAQRIAANDGFTMAQYDAKTTRTDKYIYLLGEDSKEVKKAVYKRDSAINSALDSYEKKYIEDEDDGYSGSDTRSTPTNVDAENSDYLPLKADNSLNYGIYTGYHANTVANAGDYEPVKGSTTVTRKKAYGEFISFLKDNYLIGDEEDLTDVTGLEYIVNNLVGNLETVIVDKYNNSYVAGKENALLAVEGGKYVNLEEYYSSGSDSEYAKQANEYSDSSKFESAIGNISDTSFILYSPVLENNRTSRYGYVYNILLPFSKTQERELDGLKSARDSLKNTEPQKANNRYFYDRNQLLKEITTTDQREAWFNGSTDYSFDASKSDMAGAFYTGGNTLRNYLFFEDNLTKGGDDKQYKAIDRYDGRYSYNGKVIKNADGSYRLVPNTLGIDDMLEEFKNYIDYVFESAGKTNRVTYTDNNVGGAFFNQTDFYDAADATGKKIDYSKFVYAQGSVSGLEDIPAADMYVKDNARYMAMAAVNELQYAYTTDTGVLSQYAGYTVSAYSTSYIKEFEYAAKLAVGMVKNGAFDPDSGVGHFTVCAGDYGWHLIYVTDVLEIEYDALTGKAVYTPDWTTCGRFDDDRVGTKGTFENRFYNWIKDSVLVNETSAKRTLILNSFNTDKTVTKDEGAYSNLLA